MVGRRPGPTARAPRMTRDAATCHGLDPEREVVVYCHHGIRSADVVQWLRAQGR